MIKPKNTPKNTIDLETLSLFIVLVVLTIATVVLFKVFLFGPEFSLVEFVIK